MLDSLLYRMRRSAIKKPANLILVIFALAMMGIMIYYPTLIAEELPAYNPETAIGMMSILSFVMFNIVASGMLNGTISGYTLSDVNFHLAGPFTPKFNKIIGIINTSKSGVLMAFVLCCQAAILSSVATFKSFDMICMLFVVFYSTVVAGCLANIVSPYTADEDNPKIKKIITIAFIAIDAVSVIVAFIALVTKAGSVNSISSLGSQNIIATIGNSACIKYFPFSGFITNIYAGIVTGNILTLAIGIILTALGIFVLVVLYNKLDMEYYEAAIGSAMKIADFVEAKKAGIDSDTAKLNRNVKVGNEVFNKGWGVNTFMHVKLFEFKRQTKFFFINPLALLYRVIVCVYLIIIMSAGGSEATDPFVMGMVMNIVLNAIIYAGGKTVLEFNRPYFFLAPYSAASKLFHCIMGEFPCMLFDSLICVVTLIFFAGVDAASPISWVLLFVVMTLFDISCTMISILGIRLFRGLGRYGLLFSRYLGIYIYLIIAWVASLVIMGVLDAGMEIALTSFILITTAFTAIIFAMSPIIVNNVES